MFPGLLGLYILSARSLGPCSSDFCSLASGSQHLAIGPPAPVFNPLRPSRAASLPQAPSKHELVTLTFYYKYNTHRNITNNSNTLTLFTNKQFVTSTFCLVYNIHRNTCNTQLKTNSSNMPHPRFYPHSLISSHWLRPFLGFRPPLRAPVRPRQSDCLYVCRQSSRGED